MKPSTVHSTPSPVLVSGAQPTNALTLGTYLGAIKNWVELQTRYDCYFMAVDLHAITLRQDPVELRRRTYEVIAYYLASGIDPKRATLFVQSHVSEHAELAWVMTCFATMGELGRMTQFKDKSARSGEHIPAGLFAYPALMAADILLYRAALVPVGQDQKQHLELTRDLAQRLNQLTRAPLPGGPEVADTATQADDPDPLFVVPEPYIPPVGAKIMSLQDPTRKMSKSDPDPHATVFMTDTAEVLQKKFKRAVTDSGAEIEARPDKPGVSNLLSIQSALTGQSTAALVETYRGKQYGHLKLDTAALIETRLGPIRAEANRWLADLGALDALLAEGARVAREQARLTLERVYDRLGFIRRRH